MHAEAEPLIFVFSFNRGVFLKNCISSIEKAIVNPKITIIDDNSNDPVTIEILKELSRSCEVVRNQNNSEVEFKCGGLYGSMNKAVELALQKSSTYAIFIQDDMQFVRPFTEFDMDCIINFFSYTPNSFQLSTNFVRKIDADYWADTAGLSTCMGAFLPTFGEINATKRYFSDTGIFHIPRLVRRYGKILIGEGENSTKAKQLGLVCGRSSYPFMNWLPYPSSYRGKRRGLKLRLFEYLGGAGFHPINKMSDGSVELFLAKAPEDIPIAEEWLSAPTAPRHDVWSTGGGEYNLLARGGAPSFVFKGLRSVKHRFSGGRANG